MTIIKRVTMNTITHGLWADQPTDFRMPKTQNSLKLKKFEKNFESFLGVL